MRTEIENIHVNKNIFSKKFKDKKSIWEK